MMNGAMQGQVTGAGGPPQMGQMQGQMPGQMPGQMGMSSMGMGRMPMGPEQVGRDKVCVSECVFMHLFILGNVCVRVFVYLHTKCVSAPD